MARDAIARLGVCQFDAAGFEADDLLATLAVRLSAGGTPVTVVSSDKDLLQLVREDREGEDGGGEEEEEGELGARHTFGAVALAHPFKRTVRGVAEVERAYGVRPDQLPGLFALVGDGHRLDPRAENLMRAPGEHADHSGVALQLSMYALLETCVVVQSASATASMLGVAMNAFHSAILDADHRIVQAARRRYVYRVFHR